MDRTRRRATPDSYAKFVSQSKDKVAAQSIDGMRFSRNQIMGALILIALIWMVILYRMLFSRA